MTPLASFKLSACVLRFSNMNNYTNLRNYAALPHSSCIKSLSISLWQIGSNCIKRDGCFQLVGCGTHKKQRPSFIADDFINVLVSLLQTGGGIEMINHFGI